MSPSDLPWWAWLLSGIGCAVVGIFFAADQRLKRLLGLALILAGIVCTLMGLIGLVKWVRTV